MARGTMEAAIASLEARMRGLERQQHIAAARIAALTGGLRIVNVVLAESIGAGESGNATVVDFDGTDEVETNQTIEVFNRYGRSFSAGAAAFALERPWKTGWDLLVGDC